MRGGGVKRGRCLKGPTHESGRRWSTWERATRLARPARALQLSAPGSGKGTISVIFDLQDDGGGCPSTPKTRRGRPVPWHPTGLAPPGPARVTLGEPPSPPRALLSSSPPTLRTLPGGVFDAHSGRRVLNPWKQGAPRKRERNYHPPTRPNP